MSSAAYAFPHKSAEAFRTISEVASELDVPQHVLRFWESRFTQIKPVKRAGGRRYYRPEDVDLLKGIRALLYSDGFTIKGVQKVLKERGLRHVADVGRGDLPQAPAPVVIEKIVYVEKPSAPVVAPAPVKKARPTHLRAVPLTPSLPFFDEPVPAREFPVLDTAPVRVEEAPDEVVEPVVEPVSHALRDDILAAEERARLEELLDEFEGLKNRLRVARQR
ncbi:MAG TPA: MerR family transcriptional regulator [Rhizomicrobium sp.]|nr:MerR family transcriptional regulator [Rhizomicrobium sp.]